MYIIHTWVVVHVHVHINIYFCGCKLSQNLQNYFYILWFQLLHWRAPVNFLILLSLLWLTCIIKFITIKDYYCAPISPTYHSLFPRWHFPGGYYWLPFSLSFSLSWGRSYVGMVLCYHCHLIRVLCRPVPSLHPFDHFYIIFYTFPSFSFFWSSSSSSSSSFYFSSSFIFPSSYYEDILGMVTMTNITNKLLGGLTVTNKQFQLRTRGMLFIEILHKTSLTKWYIMFV